MTSSDQKGKYAVVTGSSSGIGEHIAVTLLQQGWNVACVVRTPTKMIDRLKHNKIEYNAEKSTNIAIIKADLATPNKDNIENVKKDLEKFLGEKKALHLLVNNAGAFKPVKFGEIKLEDLQWNFNLLSAAPVLLTQAFHSFLKNSKDGSVVNISSVITKVYFPGAMLYGMAKSALDYATKHLSLVCGMDNIRVNGILLAHVKTNVMIPDNAGEKAAAMKASIYDEFAKGYPAGKIGTTNDITQAVLFMSNSQQSGWMNGHNLVLDGSITNIHANSGFDAICEKKYGKPKLPS